MSTVAQRHSICARCIFARGIRPSGKCPCPLDPQGADIIEHAQSGICPAGFYEAAEISPETLTSKLRDLLFVRKMPLPSDWAKWENVRESYREEMKAAAALEVPPFSGNGRGLVTVAGGRYFPSAYVQARILQYVECKLPVEIWYLGPAELSDKQRSVLEGTGARCIDLFTVAERLGLDWRPDGWDAKIFAIIHSSFKDVLFLDADNYPVRDPSDLFDHARYRECGCLLWPDQPYFDLGPEYWNALGLTPVLPRDAWGIEVGQMVIDKERLNRALYLGWWIDRNRNYYYANEKQFWHGDCNTLSTAIRYFGGDYGLPPKRWDIINGTLLQYDLAGELLFLHRVGDKFHLEPTQFVTPHQNPDGMNMHLPLELVAHGFMAELRKMFPVAPEVPPIVPAPPRPKKVVKPCGGCRRARS